MYRGSIFKLVANEFRPRFTGSYVQVARLSNAAEVHTEESKTVKGLHYVVLNNPKKRNVLSLNVLNQLEKALQISASNSTRVIAISANGPVFSAGHDLAEFSSKHTSEQHAAVFRKLSDVLSLIRTGIDVPVIAQVHAGAYAAGCQLVASCDMAVASRTAEFGVPGIKLGLFCATPSVAVARAANANQKRVFELLVTGSTMPAEEAERVGLIGRVCEPAALVSTVEQIAARICEQSRAVIAHGKRAYYEQLGCGPDVRSAYKLAEAAMCENLQLPDGRAGVQAFLEKRKPKWSS